MPSPSPSPSRTPPQAELPLDHAPALEQEMRALFDTRWRRWHPAASYEDAVADPVTRRLLALAAQHLPQAPTPKRTRCRR